MEIVRDSRQQTDNDELRCSDRIGRDRQGKYGQWHDEYLFARSWIAGLLDSLGLPGWIKLYERNMGEGDLHDNRQSRINTFELIS